MKKRIVQVLSLVLVFAVAGCSLTSQSRSTEKRGFLKDYSQLSEGTGDQAHYRYINDKTDFKKYTKIKLEPIQVWKNEKSSLDDMDKEDIQALVDYLKIALEKELGKRFKFVKTSGDDVMTLRIAITDAKGSNVAMDIISHALPVGLGISVIKKAATGAHTFVGGAAIEGEILDSKTNERLGAFVDERVGALRLRDIASKLSDPKGSFDYWAELLAKRLTELQK